MRSSPPGTPPDPQSLVVEYYGGRHPHSAKSHHPSIQNFLTAIYADDWLQPLRKKDLGIELLYLNREQSVFEQVAVCGFAQARGKILVHADTAASLTAASKGLCAYAAATGESLLIDDRRFDVRYVSVGSDSIPDKTLSEIVVPIKRGATVLGVFNLEASEVGAFHHEHVEYLESISELTAILLSDDSERYAEQFVTKAFSSVLGAVERSDQFAREILKSVLDLLGQRCGAVLVPGHDFPEDLRVAASENYLLKEGASCAVSSMGTIKRAITDRHACYKSDLRGDLHDAVSMMDMAENNRRILAKSDYSEAVWSGDKLLFVLNIESANIAITERYRLSISRLLNHVAPVLATAERLEELSGYETLRAIILETSVALHNVRGYEKAIRASAVVTDARASANGLSPDARAILEFHELVMTRIDLERSRLKQIAERPVPFELTNVGDMASAYIAELRSGASLMTDLHSPEGAAKRQIKEEIKVIHRTRVRANPHAVHWLLGNLIDNSVRHNPGVADLRLQIHIERKGDHALLRYEDNGVYDGDLSVQDSETSGMRQIQLLSKINRWDVHVSKTKNGALRYEFRMRPLPDSSRRRRARA